MITTTPRALIAASYKLIGVIAAGESPTADEEADGLSRLNSYLDSWGTQPHTMRTVLRTALTITANDQSYTVGTGGDVNIVRPQEIVRVSYVVPSSSPEVETFLATWTEDVYEAQPIKALTSGYPVAFIYRLTDPTGTLFLWPMPDQNLSGYVYSPVAVTQFAALATSYDLVPGLERALRYSLAVEIAPEFGKEIPPIVQMTAVDSVQDYKRSVYRMTDMGIDPAFWPRSAGTYNIQSDQ